MRKDKILVVKMLKDNDRIIHESGKWHYIRKADVRTTLCTGEVFDPGDGRAIGVTKTGRVTCPKCIELLKEFQRYII